MIVFAFPPVLRKFSSVRSVPRRASSSCSSLDTRARLPEEPSGVVVVPSGLSAFIVSSMGCLVAAFGILGCVQVRTAGLRGISKGVGRGQR